jgi:hypothetical protein
VHDHVYIGYQFGWFDLFYRAALAAGSLRGVERLSNPFFGGTVPRGTRDCPSFLDRRGETVSK